MINKTVLFDLDGTLLPINFDKFLKKYFKALSQKFIDLAPREEFVKILLKATEEMIKNDGSRVNSEVFMDSFFDLLGIKERDYITKRFDSFYHGTFPLLGKDLIVDKTPSRIVDALLEKDYQLVLATNPVFPIEAIIERMRWAYLAPDDFVLICHYENMHYCKPNPNFFKEIIKKLGVKPEDCMMIGNDYQNDLVAKKIGIKTFIVTNYAENQEKARFEPDWSGSLEELEEIIKKL